MPRETSLEPTVRINDKLASGLLYEAVTLFEL